MTGSLGCPPRYSVSSIRAETRSEVLNTVTTTEKEVLGKCGTESVLLFPENKACVKAVNLLCMGSCCPGLPKGQVYIKW